MLRNKALSDLNKDVKILKAIQEFIVPLRQEEFIQLENNILQEGCREPLIVWERKPGEQILIDGHNRYKICQKHKLQYKVKVKKFETIDEVTDWMINNQIGRRNLNPDQLSFYRGLKYERLKKKKGGYVYVESKGQNELLTSARLAKEFKISESTIKRDSKYARGLNFIGEFNPKLKTLILSGDTKIKKADIILFADVDKEKIDKIINEADLYNKANLIRNRLLKDIEDQLRKKNNDKIEKAQQELSAKDPIFAATEDRIQRLKGAIISAINKAIIEKDIEAINNLKELIFKLENLLLGD